MNLRGYAPIQIPLRGQRGDKSGNHKRLALVREDVPVQAWDVPRTLRRAPRVAHMLHGLRHPATSHGSPKCGPSFLRQSGPLS